MNPVGLELVIVNEIERNDPYFRHVASLKSFLRIEANAIFEVAFEFLYFQFASKRYLSNLQR